MNYDLANRAFAGLTQGVSKKPSGICPEPGCRNQLNLKVDFERVAMFPQLMSLEGLIICNGCADFRHALREAEDIAYRIAQNYRWKAIQIANQHRRLETAQEHIDQLNATFRPLLQSAALRVHRVLSRRSHFPIVDHRPLAEQLMDHLLTEETYSGETILSVRNPDLSRVRLFEVRAVYRITLVHHGRPKYEEEP